MYERVLLSTDGSTLSKVAIAEAVRLIDPATGTIVVIEVVDDPARILAQTTPAGFVLQGASGLTLDLAEEVVMAQREAAAQHLEEFRAALERAGVRHIETVVLEGLPGERIAEAARTHHCEVVVMATHGHSGLARAVLGSVADYVLRHLRGIPILLVRPAEAA